MMSLRNVADNGLAILSQGISGWRVKAFSQMMLIFAAGMRDIRKRRLPAGGRPANRRN